MNEQTILSIAEWAEARVKIFGVNSNDPLTEEVGDSTNIAYQLKLIGFDRTFVFYHTDNTVDGATAFLARALRTDYSLPNSAETMKFKKLGLVPPIQRNTAAVQAITGFVPKRGLDKQAGHLANTYVTIGGVDMVVEGNMSSGEFFDVIHFTDWLKEQIQKEVLFTLSSAKRIPYTNQGTQQLVNAVIFSLERGVASGAIAADEDDDGNLVPAFEVTYQRIEDVPKDQRANRIAPDIQFCARLAGAFHYATVTGKVTV